MKYILIIFSVFLSACCMGQTTPLVEYKEGSRKLNSFLTRAYMKMLQGNPETGALDTTVQYFQVLFSVDSSGKIGDRIIVTSVGDTARIPLLLIGAIRKTDGMWINHAGRTIWVEQSFSYRYKYMDNPLPALLPSRMDVYVNWNREHPGDFVRLEPIHCETYDPGPDHKLFTDAIKSKN